jgi:ATP-dependent Clp protease protease subunit
MGVLIMPKKLQIALFTAALALASAALAVGLAQRGGGRIANLVDNFEFLLESIYREGYAENEIEYDDPVLNQRMVFLTTDLDEKHAQAVMKKLSYLDLKQPGRPIDLYIDTLGGSGGEMLTNFIHSLRSPVNVYALDYCCSAGTIVLAGSTGTRYAFSTSRIIVHVRLPKAGPEDDDTYSPVAQESSINELFWQRFSKLPPEIYGVKKDRYYNFTAQQALEYGIIDEIITMQRPDLEQ